MLSVLAPEGRRFVQSVCPQVFAMWTVKTLLKPLKAVPSTNENKRGMTATSQGREDTRHAWKTSRGFAVRHTHTDFSHGTAITYFDCLPHGHSAEYQCESLSLSVLHSLLFFSLSIFLTFTCKLFLVPLQVLWVFSRRNILPQPVRWIILARCSWHMEHCAVDPEWSTERLHFPDVSLIMTANTLSGGLLLLAQGELSSGKDIANPSIPFCPSHWLSVCETLVNVKGSGSGSRSREMYCLWLKCVWVFTADGFPVNMDAWTDDRSEAKQRSHIAAQSVRWNFPTLILIWWIIKWLKYFNRNALM